MSDGQDGSGFVKEQQVVVECYLCGVAEIAFVRGQVRIHEPDIGWDKDTRVSLTQCHVCGDIGLIQQFRTHYFEHDPFAWSPPERLWPWPDTVALSLSVPEQLRAEHEQARNCYRVNAHTAVVVMVRRILEGVCFDHNIKEKTLMASLKKLQSQGAIDGQLVEWTTELRVLGNEGAHYTGRGVTSQDAADALALCEALLDHVYVFSRRFRDRKSVV